jgi:predicted chitinase
VDEIKELLRKNINYFEEQVEVGVYKLKYTSNNAYIYQYTNIYDTLLGTSTMAFQHILKFSTDREYLYETRIGNGNSTDKWTFRKVNKSFFKSGRSRTPSSTIHE